MQSEERLRAVVMDPKWMKSAWEKTIAAAEKYYEPGKFTTFIAYEWTVNAGGGDNRSIATVPIVSAHVCR